MRGLMGLAIGALVGAGGMYLVLRPPWGVSEVDDGPAPEATATVDAAGPAKRPKSGRSGRRKRVGDEPPPEAAAPTLTDGDRRLEWRGDVVSLPPRRIAMEEGDAEARPLDDSEISAAIARGSKGAIDCMVRAATNTDLSGSITLRMLVDAKGRVRSLRVNAPRYMHEQGLLACVRSATSRWTFAATGAPTLITAPFELE